MRFFIATSPLMFIYINADLIIAHLFQKSNTFYVGLCNSYGNQPRLTSSPPERTRLRFEPSDVRRRLRFLVRVTRIKKTPRLRCPILVSQLGAKSNFFSREFQRTEYTLTCRLRASSTRSARRMRPQRRSSPGEIPRTSHQNEKHHHQGMFFRIQ